MASLEETLAKIASQSKTGASSIEAMAKSLKELDAAKKTFTDPKGIVAIQKMSKAIEQLMISTQEYEKERENLTKAQQEGRELSEEEIKTLEKVSKAQTKAADNLHRIQQGTLKANKDKEKFNEKVEADALKNFRTNTKLGKSFTLLSGSVAKYAVQLGFLSLALKAAKRHSQAAEVQQNILIQGYRTLSKDTTTWGTSFKDTAAHIPIVGDYIGNYGKNLIDAHGKVLGFTEASLNMSDAIAKTEATAQRMGVSTEYVGDAFSKFARITGTQSPKVLKTLTEGAITVSRALGITVPEAVDFVSTRMDKFGGSAAGAIASLNNLREEAKRINDAFGRTVIRGDDVARTLQDISKETTMYAIDQRFVGGVLRENIARLQSTGKSYEQASKQANVFATAVTGKAPQWMKVFAAQDLNSQMMSSFNKGDFVEKFGSELEAAKPGLTKEIQNILSDTTMGQYSKMMLIQEKVSGTTVGIDAMSKQILKLAKHPQGIALIASQFGVTLAEAEGMVQQAKSMEERTTILTKLSAKNVDYAKAEFTLNGETYKLTKAEADAMKKIDESGASDLDKTREKKELLNSIVDQENEKISIAQEAARLDNEKIMNYKQIEKINKRILMIKEEKNKLEEKLKGAAAGSAEEKAIKDQIAIYDKMLKAKELEKSRYESKAAEAEGKTEGLKTVEDINKALLEEFKGYSINSGNEFKAIITELSDTKKLIMMAIGFGLGKFLWKYIGIGTRLEKFLAARAAGKIAGAGGGAGDGGGGGGAGAGTGDGAGGTGTPPTPPAPPAPPAQKPTTKWGKVKEKYSKAAQEHALALSTSAYLASEAMDKLTATYDKDGKEIETLDSKAAKNLKSFSGNVSMTSSLLSQLPGKMGRMGAKLGALSAAFEIGATIGQGLNKVMDHFGITADVVGQKMEDLAESSDSLLGKFLKAVGPERAGVDEQEADKKKLTTLMHKGLSGGEAAKALDEIKKTNISMTDYLKKIGKLPASGAPKGVAAKGVTTPAGGTLAGAKIPAGASTALGATPADTGAPGAPAAAGTPAAGAPAPAAATADTGGGDAAGGGSMSGSFVGGPNSDGSITLRVDNFMSVFSKANAMTKQKTIRQSSG